MVDDPAATDEESEKKSGSGGETAQAVADIAMVVAGPKPSSSVSATAVPTTGAASGELAAGSAETAAASGIADAAAAVGDGADAADGVISVAGSVLGILDGL